MALVVIRHLPNCRPVTHCIVHESLDTDVIDQEHYMTSVAEQQIDLFIEKFPEFEEATFYMDIIPPSEAL